jgi:predicted transcriptional regulator
MAPKKRIKIEKLLTEVELELMNIIWDLRKCSIKEVQNSLPKERDLAYTSVATIIKILEQKKFLESYKDDKAHTYLPLVSRQDYEAHTLKHLTENVFKGNPSSMVLRLLNEAELTDGELKEIQSLLKERLRS